MKNDDEVLTTLGKLESNISSKSPSTGWLKKMRTHILFDKKPIF